MCRGRKKKPSHGLKNSDDVEEEMREEDTPRKLPLPPSLLLCIHFIALFSTLHLLLYVLSICSHPKARHSVSALLHLHFFFLD